MKILLVDDNFVSRRLMQRHLEGWGHEVVPCEDGETAWHKFLEEEFALVISDWMMPGMNGLELVQRIRQSGKSDYVYIIMITSKGQKEDLITGLKAGADDYLTKPVDMEELKVRLRAGERIINLKKRLEEKNRQLELVNYRMKNELQLAAQIQNSLLPNQIPDIPGVHFAWFYQPSLELAGDIFNIIPLDEDHLGLYVIDVSGHGVPAALLSVTLSHLLSLHSSSSLFLMTKDDQENGIIPTHCTELAHYLNQYFQLDNHIGQFFTMLYGILNLKTLEFNYISAGHPGIFHLPRQGKPAYIHYPSFPIGVDRSARYETKKLHLSVGDRILLLSDGILEARDKSDQQFGYRRVLEILRQYSQLPLQQMTGELVQYVRQWMHSNTFEDDVTVVALEIREKDSL